MNTLKSIIVAGAFTTLSAGAWAGSFTVDETIQGSGGTVTADRIQGEYLEVADFGLGTFTSSILLDLNSFVITGPTPDPGSALGSGDYNLYALFKGGGTFSSPIPGTTTFTFTSGSFDLWLDPDADSTFADIGVQDSTSLWGVTEGTADVLLASGSLLSGEGLLAPGIFGQQCIPSNNICGTFGTSTTIELTAAGSTYFISPNPFYNTTFESGTLRNFTPAGRQEISGDGSVIFVPEPNTLMLFGLGILGLAGLARRKTKA